MCATCGCAGDEVAGHVHEDGTWHEDGPGHVHDGHHPDGQHSGGEHAHTRTVTLAEKVLARNDALARENRDWLCERGILALNLMSSPGAGKTTLLERTAADLAGELVVGVIEGDQETALDSDRMRAAGCQVVQVNTGTGCHLDAVMVRDALAKLDPPGGSVVVIENVGNLVCPALFDLGEAHRVVLASVTEGADKPVKYPHMFRSADLVLVTKTDLLPYLDFDLARCTADLGKISPGATVLPVSARTGLGFAEWYGWLRALLARGGTPPSRGQAPGPHGPGPPDDLRPVLARGGDPPEPPGGLRPR
jgi:hydrogenase nickel incorporation protein HypB